MTEEPAGRHDVRLSSIYRSKGLDAKAVVVCEVDRFVQEDFVKLMYVACSRARSYLSVLLTESASACLGIEVDECPRRRRRHGSKMSSAVTTRSAPSSTCSRAQAA